ncbi:RlpA-like double-psi beta-barrel-protein domain-containing protein-containing protein [Cristinia sonorae]|uniref:RlpA-like double-psi beta-barrel-protein domain-containing protein-containing protein n=1 Tax=Cristinia sonorae TaxID=1940300 RepID=A0A8K0UX77_9AGAR|nr:RlpA-like double-psi beta-barrel-protein domain-containing protein-containing protein [Cristinia sonorae]
MFGLLSLATVALSAVSAANGLAIPRATKPASYAEGYLENYDVYHTRYMELKCNLKHDTKFFDSCCHPLLATQTLEKDRAPECNPANQEQEQDDGDCDEEPSSSVAPVSSTHAPAPSSTHAHTSATPAPAPSPPPAPVNVAPEPPKAPAPSPSKPAPPPPAPAPPKPTPAPSSGGAVNSGGFATFFFQNGVAGACGKVNPDSAFIAAIDQDRYGNSGNESPLCGKQVQITNTKNGKTVTVTIADDCPTCVNSNSIDLSVGAFTQIATEEEGMVPITWKFL